MKNKMIKMAALSTAVLALSGCNKAAEEKPVDMTLDTIEKKVSYIFGYNTTKQINSQDAEFVLDEKVVAEAIKDVYAGKESRVTEEEMRATMMTFQAQMQEKQQAAIQKQQEENKAKSDAFLAENSKREGVTTTESGLQYEVLTAGTGASPAATDKVKVNYSGSLLDGTVFDSGEGVEFVVNRLIPSWVEALPMMKEGGKWKIYSPADLAYGQGGTGRIPPNSTLIFEMELVSIVKGDEAADKPAVKSPH